eukprot:TRINITY_DN3787_c0_g1_i1.p3 TRINITY_DN3787_c0_g1~~TRINITY_DN3787_c0_g1_i1.p3  ORF type:complete len:188 (+),score=49.68 TRINITY_DN3787_c0_g1_i1:536-1099(+)
MDVHGPTGGSQEPDADGAIRCCVISVFDIPHKTNREAFVKLLSKAGATVTAADVKLEGNAQGQWVAAHVLVTASAAAVKAITRKVRYLDGCKLRASWTTRAVYDRLHAPAPAPAPADGIMGCQRCVRLCGEMDKINQMQQAAQQFLDSLRALNAGAADRDQEPAVLHDAHGLDDIPEGFNDVPGLVP